MNEIHVLVLSLHRSMEPLGKVGATVFRTTQPLSFKPELLIVLMNEQTTLMNEQTTELIPHYTNFPFFFPYQRQEVTF